MRCLGLDLGTRTCGLAMSDKTNFIASPFKTLKWDGENYDLLFIDAAKAQYIKFFNKLKIKIFRADVYIFVFPQGVVKSCFGLS